MDDLIVNDEENNLIRVCDKTIDCGAESGDESIIEFCQYCKLNKNGNNCSKSNEHRLLLRQHRFYKNILNHLERINEQRNLQMIELINKQEELCQFLDETQYEIEQSITHFSSYNKEILSILIVKFYLPWTHMEMQLKQRFSGQFKEDDEIWS